ncbi:hypothetical protein ACOSQ3_011845 [Xanthoceras sorbifolium]
MSSFYSGYGSRSYIGEMNTSPNEKTWCVAKAGTSDDVLQSNIDFACSQPQVDCGPIQSGAPCFLPDDQINHASYAMNSYFQNYGKTPETCDFSGSGIIVTLDPSNRSIWFDGCDGWLRFDGGDGLRFDGGHDGRLGDGVPF